MTPSIFAAAALLAGAASLFASWIWWRASAYCVLVAALLALWCTAIGIPRPSWLGHTPGTKVLAMQLDEGNAIYLWTRSGDAPPIAFALPWNEQRAAKIRRMMQAGKLQHRDVRWGTAGGGSGKPGRTGVGHKGPAGSAAGPAGNNAFGGASSSGINLAPHSEWPDKTSP